MTLYTFLSVDPARNSVEVETCDPAAALAIINDKQLGEVDILEDGEYAFSCKVRADTDWTIFRRLCI